jgi:hypothetical protein
VGFIAGFDDRGPINKADREGGPAEVPVSIGGIFKAGQGPVIIGKARKGEGVQEGIVSARPQGRSGIYLADGKVLQNSDDITEIAVAEVELLCGGVK